MQKIGSGYTNFFNRKYQREGHLFQGKFLASHVSGEEYLKTVFVYIHTNPVLLIEPEWKEKGIEEPERAIVFLEGYRWSSYFDYLGKENFPSLTERIFWSGIQKSGNYENVRRFVGYL
jgi:putative transposase